VPQIRLEVASEDSELPVTSTSLNASVQTLENNQIESDTSKKSDSINFCPSNKGASNYLEASQEDERFFDLFYLNLLIQSKTEPLRVSTYNSHSVAFILVLLILGMQLTP